MNTKKTVKKASTPTLGKGDITCRFSCRVSWSELNEKDKSDIQDKRLFEKSILGYVNAFNSLPPVGLRINNGNCDAAKIEDVFFNGINNSIYVYLSF